MTMDFREAQDWLEGGRSMVNLIPSGDFETWQVRIAQADAAMLEQAWIVYQYHTMKNKG
jgi:hypothetical protein